MLIILAKLQDTLCSVHILDAGYSRRMEESARNYFFIQRYSELKQNLPSIEQKDLEGNSVDFNFL